jgi:oxygen-independent coproporphyrinogen-3 oxidase
VRRQGGSKEWLAALEAEVESWADRAPTALSGLLRTVFVGGGTPSLLGPGAMGGLRRILGSDVLPPSVEEWTAEANPESFTPELARDWAEAGVNRVSLGVQTFDPAGLRWMGRLHGPDGARVAVRAGRDAGLENLSVDLIFGLPPRLGRDLDRDLDQLLALDLPHVSLYGLSIEAGTALARWLDEGREEPLDDAVYAEEYLRIAERLTSEGYRHYEVSNFARPGRESIHNQAYWSGAPYLGLGNSAHSFLPPVRSWNLRDWDAYSSGVSERRSPVESTETLSPADRELEELWLGLRTSRGVSTSILGETGRALFAEWVREGTAWHRDDRVGFEARGWLVMDERVVALSSAMDRAGGRLTGPAAGEEL